MGEAFGSKQTSPCSIYSQFYHSFGRISFPALLVFAISWFSFCYSLGIALADNFGRRPHCFRRPQIPNRIACCFFPRCPPINDTLIDAPLVQIGDNLVFGNQDGIDLLRELFPSGLTLILITAAPKSAEIVNLNTETDAISRTSARYQGCPPSTYLQGMVPTIHNPESPLESGMGVHIEIAC